MLMNANTHTSPAEAASGTSALPCLDRRNQRHQPECLALAARCVR